MFRTANGWMHRQSWNDSNIRTYLCQYDLFVRKWLYVFVLGISPDIAHNRDTSNSNFPPQYVFLLCQAHTDDCKLIPDGMDFQIEIVTLKKNT